YVAEDGFLDIPDMHGTVAAQQIMSDGTDLCQRLQTSLYVGKHAGGRPGDIPGGSFDHYALGVFGIGFAVHRRSAIEHHAGRIGDLHAQRLRLDAVMLADFDGIITADRVAVVIHHFIAHILLRAHVHQFASQRVLEDHLVAHRRIAVHRLAAEPALGGAGGQLHRRHVVGVVDAAQHDGAVRAAADEVDHDFVVDARQLQAAEAAAGPRAGYAHPA